MSRMLLLPGWCLAVLVCCLPTRFWALASHMLRSGRRACCAMSASASRWPAIGCICTCCAKLGADEREGRSGDINCRGKTVHAPPGPPRCPMLRQREGANHSNGWYWQSVNPTICLVRTNRRCTILRERLRGAGHLSHSLHHSKRLVILPGPGHHSAPGASYGMTLNGHPFNGSHNASSIGGGGSVRWKPMGPEVIEEYNRKEERHRPEAGAEEFLPHKFFFTSPSVRFAAQKSFAVPF
eukprot:16275-Rhodomonas_salina.4